MIWTEMDIDENLKPADVKDPQKVCFKICAENTKTLPSKVFMKSACTPSAISFSVCNWFVQKLDAYPE